MLQLLSLSSGCFRCVAVGRRVTNQLIARCKTTTNTTKDSSTKLVVPVVDMSLPHRELGKAVHEACTTVGFFHLVNHGVSEDLRRKVLEEARNMFTSLSPVQKETFSVAHSNSYRGYQRMGVNITRHKQDGHEGFDLISESPRAIRTSTKDNPFHGLTNHGQNQWPDPKWVPQLRPTLERYIKEMNMVGNRLMSASSTGLGLGPDYFKPYFTDPYWTMRLCRYPAVASPENSNKADDNDDDYNYGVGEHTDYGVFTMILADSVPDTLQIRPKRNTTSHHHHHHHHTRDEEWWTVDPIEGGFVCNIGDMLARWTNGIYVSTPHRVLRPRMDRVSVPFFFDPNYDAQIGPIDQLSLLPTTECSESELKRQIPRFEPIMYGDHLLAKTSKNFVL
jgi:isopenicillin N synthase-like dioxygenase